MTPDTCPSLLEELQRLEARIAAAFVAPGGRHGLVVRAMPGGLHDGRVRRNERSTVDHGEARAAAYLDSVGA